MSTNKAGQKRKLTETAAISGNCCGKSIRTINRRVLIINDEYRTKANAALLAASKKDEEKDEDYGIEVIDFQLYLEKIKFNRGRVKCDKVPVPEVHSFCCDHENVISDKVFPFGKLKRTGYIKYGFCCHISRFFDPDIIYSEELVPLYYRQELEEEVED